MPARPGEAVYWYVTLGEETGTLSLYTEDVFEQRAAELEQSELEREELLEYERLMFSLAQRVEMDKQGRIRIPENLWKLSGLGPDVMLLGVKDHLEVRDRGQWTAVLNRVREERSGVMNPRQAMKRRGQSPSV